MSSEIDTDIAMYEAKNLVNDYLSKDIVANFDQIPRFVKLSILQKTPGIFIKTRKIGRQQVKYVEHSYARKALNFVFNFDYSCEILDKEFLEYELNGKKVVEAECTVLFTFAGIEPVIKKTVYSSHKGYANPATTRGDVLKSALSKAYTKVAQCFGMATEEEYVKTEEPPEPSEEPVVIDVETKKSFDKLSY